MKYDNLFFIFTAVLTVIVLVSMCFVRGTAMVFTASIVSVLILIAVVRRIRKNGNSVDISHVAEISENFNTEIIIWTDDFSVVCMNRKMREQVGVESAEQDCRSKVMKAFGLPDLKKESIKAITESSSFESRFINAQGSLTTISWSTSEVMHRRRKSLYISTGSDITQIKSMRMSLDSANDLFNYSMELAEIGILISGDLQNFLPSPEATRMLGLKNQNISIGRLCSLVHPNDRIQFESAVKSVNLEEESEVKSMELSIKSADGFYHWYSFRYRVKVNEYLRPIFSGTLIDSTQEHEKDMLIERLAYIDEVTEIANRNRLMDVGQEIYESCLLLGCSCWIVVFDIDRFHIVNDSCGYHKGNAVLKNFAHILYKYVTPGGLGARVSGDNFALLLRDYGDDDLPVRTAKSVQEEFSKLSAGEFSSVSLSCSAGYSCMPSGCKSFSDALEHAEFALKSQNTLNSSICVYEPRMHESITGRTKLERELALAIENNELALFYQPKIDLSTGRIMGVEALIRWIKPDGTVITPNVFVPVAESTRLIGKISEFVLNEGCRQNKLWQKMGYPPIVMSINFTSTDFYQKDLREKVFETLVKTGLDSEWLEVELTETLALTDIDYAVSQMNKLRELGVKLAMDDFGTGYSSLSYLQILPITLLKLDRSFIIDIEHDNIAYEIVSSVIRIARSKKIETIAEGIENEAQENILRKAGCDFGQGYLYGKPMPADRLQQFFEENIRKTQ